MRHRCDTVESVKLRGELHRARVLRPCRIRQAKGQLHRARVLRPCLIRQAIGNSTGRVSSARVESVKLRGELHRARVLRPCRIRQATGELHRARVLRPCRIRQAKGELHRARAQVSPPVSPPRPCRIRQVIRGNSTGRASSARVESVKLRGNSQVSPPPVSNPSS